mmetsp:Transcript_86814/g.269907  ORF Transcript_86814/g.269907 Transcript_86814/m.269907 type:complete len:446 (-) Transcript_86814:56-1393(-)
MTDFLPIREVSTFLKSWTICGRVTSKSDLRTFGKAGGGKVFNVDVLDASGSEIRANFFNQAAEALADKLQKGRCYTFSGGKVRVANKQFSRTNHKYELAFEQTWQVQDAAEDAQIKTFVFSVVDIGSLRTRRTPCKVDLCGVVVEATPYICITCKDGTELAKRDITIADSSGCSISVTIWDKRARIDDQQFANAPVVGLSQVLIKEWREARAGSLLQEGELLFNPEIPEAAQVRQWWTQGGCNQSLEALSKASAGEGGGGENKVATLAELREAVGRVTHCQVFIVFCRLHSVQTTRQGEPMPLYYNACQESKGNGSFTCNRRVDESGFCAGCNRIVQPELRLNIRCHYSDASDSNWIGTFHIPAVTMLGIDADEAKERESAGREKLEAAINEQYYTQPLQIMVRAKSETWNGEARINVGVIDACPVDLGERGRDLLQEIRQMMTE